MSKFKYLLLLVAVSIILNVAILWYQESYDLLAFINSTFFTGSFVIGPGLLIFVANSGALGTMIFFIKKGFLTLIKNPKKDDMDFYIFQAMRNSIPPYTYLFMFLVGGLNLVVMFVLLAIYHA